MKYFLSIICFANLVFSCRDVSNPPSTPRATDTALTTVAKDSLKKPDDTTTKRFNGAWFDISYPASFTATPSLRSTTSKEGFESVFFTSPDGEVIFYVFSPQWGGEPTDIDLKKGELLISQDSSANEDLQREVKHWTIEATDKSYRRSYEETIMDQHINWVLGIQYKNEAAYKKYQQQYLAFKKSLLQYAD